MDMEIAFPGGKKADAVYKDFTIRTDQGRASGGESSAPTPFDLFLASIGTCAGFYVLVFCEKRSISAEKVKLVLRTERNKESGMIGKIMIEIQLPSEFPETYRKAVIKAAESCAVKKHIDNPPLFNVYTKAQEGTE